MALMYYFPPFLQMSAHDLMKAGEVHNTYGNTFTIKVSEIVRKMHVIIAVVVIITTIIIIIKLL